jgi:hypothetical protein
MVQGSSNPRAGAERAARAGKARYCTGQAQRLA